MSYAIFVGKNLTIDGTTYLAGYGDEPSSHWLEITPRRTHPADATITVGVTEKADLPGRLSQIPQVGETAKYIGVNYSYYKGVPAPLTNGGLNEYGVAVRDVWSPSRPELQAMTPKDQTGPNYSDLARLVLEQAKTAREGVELVGELIANYGYSTYGGNSHFFADHNEGWVIIEFAGGQGLWVAERVGPDDLRISRPGYIGDIPLDFADNPNYLGSPNLISFAIEQGWYDPDGGEPFNGNKIYGDGKMRWGGVAWIEEELQKRAQRLEKIGLKDVMWAVRTPKLTSDTAGYGQVVPLRSDKHPELGLLWHTQTAAVTAPFMPFWLGVMDVPPEYKKHRYLTAGESGKFLPPPPDFTNHSIVSHEIEATRSAFRSFKRLFYLTMQHHEKFLPEVLEILEAFESKLIAHQADVEKTANTLYEADEAELARQYLTYYSNTEAMNALWLAETLADSLEMRTKLLFGIDQAAESNSPDVLW